MKNKITILLFIVSSIIGCKKENELKKSVWIPDPEYSDLPAYSEWGYNTFGVYYDRLPFISNNDLVPAKVVYTNDQTTFELYGQLGDPYTYGDYEKMSMKFRISGFKPLQYSDLISLNHTTLDLTDTLNRVIIIRDTAILNVKIISGELFFKRAQNLIVDKKPIEVILSGYFDFKALVNSEPITVWEGRFDVGVGSDNFYIY
jgi:hypothetical protein